MDKMKLIDVYDGSIPHEETALNDYVTPKEWDMYFPLKTLSIDELKKLKAYYSEDNIIKDFNKNKTKSSISKVNVLKKLLRSNQDVGIIVISGDLIIDGHHRVIAAIIENKPLEALDIQTPINENLNESASLNRRIIIVDIQPAYDKFCKHIVPKLINFLNHRTGEIVLFYNGEDVGVDNKIDVMGYYLDNGLDEDKLGSIIYREKTYAFFRNWMDAGMKRSDIIKAIRYMVTARKNDSRDVTEEEWIKVFGESDYEGLKDTIEMDSINIPDISISELKSWNGSLICGGGRHECFEELTLLFNAFNIKYTEIKSLIY